MSTIIKHRRDTAANWKSVNPVLADGEIGIETDTRQLKMGDGVSTWKHLTSYVSSGPGAMNFRGQPCSISHGKFWTQDTEYGKCYWSAWVCPLYQNTDGYFISDGAGGMHNVLTGVATNTTHARYTGNIFDGSNIWTMSSCDLVPLGDWVHYEFIYDLTNFYILLNGICTFYGKIDNGNAWTSGYTGVRKYTAGGSNGALYVGGSDHNNFPGLIARVRGFEGGNCGITSENRAIPFWYTGEIGTNLGAATRAQFVCDYSMPNTRTFIDLGAGFESRSHHGTMVRYEANPLSINFTEFPNFVGGEPDIANLSTYAPTPDTPPGGCLVFDSFSRPNSLEIQESQQYIPDDVRLGNTEAGSLGILPWKTGHFSGNDVGVGLLYGSPITYGNFVAESWVITDRTDVDIRVTKPAQPWVATGILARRIDASNYYRIYTGPETLINFEFMQSGVQTFPSTIAIPGGWTELKVTMIGTTMTIYTDGVSRGTKTVVNNPSAVKHGFYFGHICNRASTFTIMPI